MPSFLVRFLETKPLRQHFLYALLLGALARLCSAVFVYGPQALDDYKHGVWPAYQFFAGLPLDLPEYRSHLLVWLLSSFVYLASWLGLDSALSQVRAMYLGLGALSLIGVYATYVFVRTRAQPLFGAVALYWMALYPLLPFTGTRAFGEAVSMSLVALAFAWLERTRLNKSHSLRAWFMAFALLGVATLFRFHVGILFVAYMVVVLYLRLWRGLTASILAGVLTIGLQTGVDLLSGKVPMRTLIAYLEANEGGAAKYGVSPWYNPWLFVLGVALVPFALTLWRGLPRLWREQWTVLAPWLLFVFIHSLVPHKEERFLYPILILEFWAVTFLWAQGASEIWVRRVFASAVLLLGSLGLLIVCFVNTQEGEIEPPAYIQSRYPEAVYLDYQSLFGRSRFQFYFLRPPSVLKAVNASDFNAHRVDEEFAAYPQHQAVAMLTSEPEARDQLRALEGMRSLEGECLKLREAGSLVDRLLYAMNPKHNQRRRPTWYLICERRRS